MEPAAAAADGTSELVVLGDGAALWTESVIEPDAAGLVLLHGGPGLWDYLAPVAELLAGHVSTLRYDQRGCGRSSPSTDYRLARYVADLDELRAYAGFDRWYVFGHSFSATLALAYAAAHRDRVQGVVYSNGVGLHWSRHKDQYEARARARLTAAQADRLDQLTRRPRGHAEEIEWRTLSRLPDHPDPSTAPALAARAAAVPLPLNLECNRTLNTELKQLEAHEEALARDVAAPVLLLHGGADPRPDDGVRALANALPDARLLVIDPAGHEPWHEHPTTLRNALLSFLAEPPRSASRRPAHR